MHCEQVGGWLALHECMFGNVKGGPGCEKEEVSMCKSLLLAMERVGET